MWAAMHPEEKLAESIFYGISILGLLLGGIFWLSNIDYQGKSNKDDIAQIKAESQQIVKQYQEIVIRLTHIEDRIERRR